MKKIGLMLSIAAVLTGGLVIGAPGVNASASLSDINDHWAKASIEEAVLKGYVKGYPDGTFRPEANVSRAEFLSIVTRATGLSDAGAIEPFTDVEPSHWAIDTINKGIGMGFINPEDYGTKFEPSKALTRAEMVKWLVSGLAKSDSGFVDALEDTKETILPFTEYYPGKFKEADIPYIAVARGTGLVGGFPDGSFGPDRTTTRAEAVVILLRYLGIEGTDPTQYRDLEELREVGTTGTNVRTIGKATWAVDGLSGKELPFPEVFNKKLAVRLDIGEVYLRHYIITDLESVYIDMFMDEEAQEWLQRNNDSYGLLTEVTLTPNRDLERSQLDGDIFQSTFQVRSGIVQKYGYPALLSTGGDQLLKKGKTNTFWTRGSTPKWRGITLFTTEGRARGFNFP